MKNTIFLKPPLLSVELGNDVKILIIQRKLQMISLVEVYAEVLKKIKEKTLLNGENEIKLKDSTFIISIEYNVLNVLRFFSKEYKKDDVFQVKNHFFSSLISDNICLSTLIALYRYTKTNTLNNNEKYELSIGRSTIVFSINKDKISLITGWDGNRKKVSYI